MSLIRCPECGKKISSQAIVCPQCGYPIKRATPPPIPTSGEKVKSKPSKGCLVGFGWVVFVFAFIFSLDVLDKQDETKGKDNEKSASILYKAIFGSKNSASSKSSSANNEHKKETDIIFPTRVGAYPTGMALIPAGTNSGINPDFGAYSITITNSFSMDITEVTKSRWVRVYNWAKSEGYQFNNAGSGKSSDCPVNKVNWYDVVKWCNALSEKEGRTPCYMVNGRIYKNGQIDNVVCNFSANGFRLPTVEEWEYAARGGLKSKRFPWGDTIDHSKANYHSSPIRPAYDLGEATDTMGSPIPVGSFPPNGYGLYDMVGNVWEWCWDTAFQPNLSSTFRCFRGGCYYFSTSTMCFGGKNLMRLPAAAGDYDGFRTVCR